MATKVKRDRTDPKANRSLAIRQVLAKTPDAPAAGIVQAVKAEFGHDVTPTLVYLVKAKANRATAKRKVKRRINRPATGSTSLTDAIRHAKALLRAAGDPKAAAAILTALRD